MGAIHESLRELQLSDPDRPTTCSAQVSAVTPVSSPNPAAGPSKGDTPARPRAVRGSEYQSSDLENRRRLTMQDIVHVCEITSEQFIKLLVPQLPYGVDVDAICREMDGRNLWQTHFASDPADSNENETATFKHLDTLFNEMCSIATREMITVKDQQFCLQTAGNAPLETNVIKCTSNPDVAFVKCNSPHSTPLSWYNIAFPLEFKKKDELAGVDDVSA